jgi:hypothetical protein
MKAGGRALISSAAALILLGACTDAEESSSQSTPRPTEATDDPEIEWVVRVAEAAGFQLQPTGGGAPEISREPSTFRMWAFVEGQKDRRTTLRAEGYERVGTLGGIELFSDGQRLTWKINGIYVWLSGVEGINAETLGVADLVQASTEFAWDGGHST